MHSRSDVNTSSAAIYALINGEPDREVPINRLPLFVSVKDVALAHVKALEVDEAKGHRFLLCGGAFTWEQVCSDPTTLAWLRKLNDILDRLSFTLLRSVLTSRPVFLKCQSRANRRKVLRFSILRPRKKYWALKSSRNGRRFCLRLWMLWSKKRKSGNRSLW